MGAFRLNHSFGISVVLHCTLLLALLSAGRLQKVPALPRTLTWIEVDPPTSYRARTPESKSRQIVQTERAQEAKEAAPDAHLSERTQRVDEQKVSSRKDGQAAQTPRVVKAPPPRLMPPGAHSKAGPLSNLGVALPPPGARPKDHAPPEEDRASLRAQARGEYVKGFKEGERTLLNTREYVFYSYFQRIREKLDRAWEVTLREKLEKYFHRGRQLASEMDYTTQLLVTMDENGHVVKVQTVGASGTHDLDEAAVRAFNEAGPFPNPPKGLVESGQVQVRWDFVLRT